MTEYGSIILGADTTAAGPFGANSIAVAAGGGRNAGDTLLSAVVVVGTVATPAGTDVKGAFEPTLQKITDAHNIATFGNGQAFVIQLANQNLSGCEIEALFHTP